MELLLILLALPLGMALGLIVSRLVIAPALLIGLNAFDRWERFRGPGTTSLRR